MTSRGDSQSSPPIPLPLTSTSGRGSVVGLRTMAGLPPPSPARSSASASFWAVDPSPLRHQCITELLHDPRAASLFPDLASLASFGASTSFSAGAASGRAAPVDKDGRPRPKPATINDFATYLRRVQEPYKTFLSSRDADESTRVSTTAVKARIRTRRNERMEDKYIENKGVPGHPTEEILGEDDDTVVVPEAFYSESFSVGECQELAALQVTSATLHGEDPAVLSLRAALAAYRSRLEEQLHEQMGAARDEVDTALSRVRALREAVAAAASATRTARADAAAVVESTAAGSVDITSLGRRKENAIRLKVALGGVSHILSASEDAHLLVDAVEYAAAIRTVEGARSSLAQGDLARVAALAPARAKLARAVERIDTALRDEFCVLMSATRVDTKQILHVVRLVARLGRSQLALRAFIDDVRKSLDKQLNEAKSIDAAAFAARSAAKRAALISDTFVQAMSSAEEADTCFSDVVRAPDRQGIPEMPKLTLGAVAGEVGGSSTPCSPAAATFTFEEAVNDTASAAPSETFTAVGVDGGPQYGNRPSRGSMQDNASAVLGPLHDEILDLLCGVVDRLLGSFGKNSEYIVLTPDDEVTELNCFDEAKGALRFGEAMRSLDLLGNDISTTLGLVGKSGGRSSALRSKVSERSLAFVMAIHSAHAEAITGALQSDRWAEVKVPLGVSRLVAGVTGDSNRVVERANGNISSSTDDLSGLVVHEEVFKTTAAGLRYARSVCAFALFSEKLPFAASEAARRGVELSRLFNSLCGRAILGASAIQWSGLRSITARHLALAARTIALATALSPHICSLLQNAVATSQASVVGALMRKSEKDCRDHHGQLLAKILSIMMDRLAVHEEGLLTLPWNKALEMERFDVPSLYITTLAKEALVLHKILWSILPSGEVCDIFQRVLDAYGSRLSSGYAALDVSKPWVRDRVIADVSHLRNVLLQLDVIQFNPDMFKPVAHMHQRFDLDLQPAVQSEESPSSPPVGTSPSITTNGVGDSVDSCNASEPSSVGVIVIDTAQDINASHVKSNTTIAESGTAREQGALSPGEARVTDREISEAVLCPPISQSSDAGAYGDDSDNSGTVKRRYLSLSTSYAQAADEAKNVIQDRSKAVGLESSSNDELSSDAILHTADVSTADMTRQAFDAQDDNVTLDGLVAEDDSIHARRDESNGTALNSSDGLRYPDQAPSGDREPDEMDLSPDPNRALVADEVSQGGSIPLKCGGDFSGGVVSGLLTTAEEEHRSRNQNLGDATQAPTNDPLVKKV